MGPAVLNNCAEENRSEVDAAVREGTADLGKKPRGPCALHEAFEQGLNCTFLWCRGKSRHSPRC